MVRGQHKNTKVPCLGREVLTIQRELEVLEAGLSSFLSQPPPSGSRCFLLDLQEQFAFLETLMPYR